MKLVLVSSLVVMVLGCTSNSARMVVSPFPTRDALRSAAPNGAVIWPHYSKEGFFSNDVDIVQPAFVDADGNVYPQPPAMYGSPGAGKIFAPGLTDIAASAVRRPDRVNVTQTGGGAHQEQGQGQEQRQQQQQQQDASRTNIVTPRSLSGHKSW